MERKSTPYVKKCVPCCLLTTSSRSVAISPSRDLGHLTSRPLDAKGPRRSSCQSAACVLARPRCKHLSGQNQHAQLVRSRWRRSSFPRPSIYLRANRLGTKHPDPLLSSLTIASPDWKSRTARQARLRTLYGRGPDCLLEVVGLPQTPANVTHSRTPLHPASSGCREIRRSKVYPDSICSSQPQDLTTSWNDHGHGAYDFSRSEPKFPLSLP